MTNPEDKLTYKEAKSEYVDALSEALEISSRHRGTPSKSGREYWGSILFGKLALTGISLDRLAPPPRHGLGSVHWDLASLAILARAMAENRLMFVYLCVQPKSEEEWLFRKTLFNIIDNYARYRLTADAGHDPDQVGYDKVQSKLRSRLEQMPQFQSLSDGRKRQLLKGDRLPYIQDDLMDSLDIDRGSFRSYYRYLSSFVHTGTISFYRMAEHGRGTGEENEYDRTAMLGILVFATSLLRSTSSEILSLFNGEL